VRIVWLTIGVLCVAIGIVATVVPLLPKTPFVLIAAFAFANSSERLHTWLLAHRNLGPPSRLNDGGASVAQVAATVSSRWPSRSRCPRLRPGSCLCRPAS
jgi:uncharacterized membrane protein YbaN (DUF454 family)